MENYVILSETNFKKWVKEAVQECFQAGQKPQVSVEHSTEEPIDRKAVAKLLKISLVTLTDRVKKGLPAYKQGRNVYLIKSEVLEYLRAGSRR